VIKLWRGRPDVNSWQRQKHFSSPPLSYFLWIPFSILSTLQCVRGGPFPGDKADEESRWALTSILCQGWEYVELYLLSPYVCTAWYTATNLRLQMEQCTLCVLSKYKPLACDSSRQGTVNSKTVNLRTAVPFICRAVQTKSTELGLPCFACLGASNFYGTQSSLQCSRTCDIGPYLESNIYVAI
jgi:hypothetical protein